MQCKDVYVSANQGIIQYNPNTSSLMATTVPSNYYDEYIGNINGFDQYVLKINHKFSSISLVSFCLFLAIFLFCFNIIYLAFFYLKNYIF